MNYSDKLSEGVLSNIKASNNLDDHIEVFRPNLDIQMEQIIKNLEGLEDAKRPRNMQRG